MRPTCSVARRDPRARALICTAHCRHGPESQLADDPLANVTETVWFVHIPTTSTENATPTLVTLEITTIFGVGAQRGYSDGLDGALVAPTPFALFATTVTSYGLEGESPVIVHADALVAHDAPPGEAVAT